LQFRLGRKTPTGAGTFVQLATAQRSGKRSAETHREKKGGLVQGRVDLKGR